MPYLNKNTTEGKTKNAVIRKSTLLVTFKYSKYWNSAGTEGNVTLLKAG